GVQEALQADHLGDSEAPAHGPRLEVRPAVVPGDRPLHLRQQGEPRPGEGQPEEDLAAHRGEYIGRPGPAMLPAARAATAMDLAYRTEDANPLVAAVCPEPVLALGTNLNIHAADEMLRFLEDSFGGDRDQALAVYFGSGLQIWETFREIL